MRDLKTERQAIDFYEFISNMDADALLYVARVVREATQGQSLVGTYYAYLTAHGINQQDSGHLAAQRVFDSPDIDFLMSPPNYWYRKPGEACTFMSASDSLAPARQALARRIRPPHPSDRSRRRLRPRRHSGRDAGRVLA